MNREIKIITLGDIFKNIETEEKAFEFLNYIQNLQQENVRLINENETIKNVRYMVNETIYKSKIDKAIEEKKIPEKLKIEQDTPTSNYYIRNENGTKCNLTKHSKMIAETLNQLIDYLESKGENNDI